MCNVTGLVENYRAELQAAGRAAGTISVRTSHVRRMLTAVDKPLSDISRGDLIEWLSSGRWGAEARASARASMVAFFRWCVDSGRLPSSPAATLPTISRPRAMPRPVPDDVIIDALATASDADRLAVEIMATMGLRRAECARIRADDVERTMHGYRLRVTGKGGHVRYVPMPRHLARACLERRGFIFPGDDQGHISPGWLGKRISRVLPADWTAHKLRHRFGTTAYGHSHDIRAVQELLGHASIETTRVYVAVDDDAIQSAASKSWTIEGKQSA